jgi:pimeloyl-ACP methyl ester carboxylesterase
MNMKANVVLVHGAWADGSSWSKVIAALQAKGVSVSAVQLPLTSLANDIATTRRLLALQDGPTVLVGHSYGGAVISGAAIDSPGVKALVYVAAFGVDEGESLDALSKQGPPPFGASQIKPDSNGFLWINREGFHKAFVADAGEAEAAVMAAVQNPLSVTSFTDKAGVAAWKTIPSWYLASTMDQMIPPPAQEFFAKRMNATVQTIPASHASMIAHSEAVADFILLAANSVR